MSADLRRDLVAALADFYVGHPDAQRLSMLGTVGSLLVAALEADEVVELTAYRSISEWHQLLTPTGDTEQVSARRQSLIADRQTRLLMVQTDFGEKV